MGAANIPKSHLLHLGAMWDWGGEYHAFSMRMGEIKKPPGISGGKSRIWAKGQRVGEFRRLKPGVGEPARREQAHRNAERAHRPVPRLGKSRFMVPSWKKNKKNKNRSKKKKKRKKSHPHPHRAAPPQPRPTRVAVPALGDATHAPVLRHAAGLESEGSKIPPLVTFFHPKKHPKTLAGWRLCPGFVAPSFETSLFCFFGFFFVVVWWVLEEGKPTPAGEEGCFSVSKGDPSLFTLPNTAQRLPFTRAGKKKKN